ncbi:MAG TPA: hypothetical protein VHD32_17690 [Candidatus Didemnitutus sp.]|nr:hypothetical protein [Candidatus Didemnitutus sp.]
MNARRLILFALAVAGPALAAPSGGQPSADWIKRTKDRITILLGPQHDKTPMPANVPNPFRQPGRMDVTQTESRPEHGDADSLDHLVSLLKINGLVTIGGVPQVLINQLLYKEGDLVAVRIGDNPIYLRVVKISPTELTLELNKVEQTIRLK